MYGGRGAGALPVKVRQHLRVTGAVPVNRPPSVTRPEPLGSIFHQPWWLEIATDRSWGEAVVRENGRVLARWPYPLRSRYGMTVSTLPTLIRTLGPVISGLPGKPATVLRRRLEITGALIDQLPRLGSFEQVFDPSIEEALAFIHRDFVVGAAYCFRIPAGQPEAAVWDGMLDKTRNVIRKAAAILQVDAIDPDEFCHFHDANLGGAVNMHGASRMRSLLVAALDRGTGMIVGARNQQRSLEAAVVFVWDASVAYYLLAARSDQVNSNGALSLLVWHGIRAACRRGLTFDLDGAVTPGMVLFLSGFGGLLTQRLRVRRISGLYRFMHAAAGVTMHGRLGQATPKIPRNTGANA